MPPHRAAPTSRSPSVREHMVRYPRPETFVSIVATKVAHRMYQLVKQDGLGEVLPGV